MATARSPMAILMADDDQEDCMLVKDASQESRLAVDISFVSDGEELLDYLRRKGKYNGHTATITPALILLDLNMPRKDGLEALTEIKADSSLRRIPVVILTTSKAEEDVFQSYDLGACGFVTKPVTFESLVQVVETLVSYWSQTMTLPGR